MTDLSDLVLDQPDDLHVYVEWLVETDWVDGMSECVKFAQKHLAIEEFDRLCAKHSDPEYGDKPKIVVHCESTTSVTLFVRDLEAEANQSVAEPIEPTEPEASQ